MFRVENGQIMENTGILVLQVNSIEGNGKVHRFRLRQNDSMKKLIEKYAEMENVIPEAIQLIFKGNPVTNNDTPNKLEITSEDILEVCKVPGIFIPAKKPSTPSPADMDDSIEEIPSSNSPEMKSVIASNFPPFVNFLNNNRLPSSPSPAKRSRHDSTSENTHSEANRNLHAGLNLEMLNYPINHFNDIKSKILSNQLSTTNTNTALNNQNNTQTTTTPAQQQQQHQSQHGESTITSSTTTTTNSNHLQNNNHITVKRITELEFELGHTKIKNKDLTQVVQMLNAKCILAQRALEEKDLIIKQKEKSIEHLNMELERRERILLAYSAATSKQSQQTSRVSPPSAGSSTGSSSSHHLTPPVVETIPNRPQLHHPTLQGPSWSK